MGRELTLSVVKHVLPIQHWLPMEVLPKVMEFLRRQLVFN